jgi:triosephosphate isomerase
MRKKKLIIGNWKMNPKTSALARSNFTSVKKESGAYKNVEAVIAAPYVYLSELSKIASAGLSLGAQNVSAEKEGAFTGEISAAMLATFKTKYIIIGHSERREMGESNAFINKKIKMVLASGMTPVLCVGEKERDQGMWYLSAVKTQIEECLVGIAKNAIPKIVIAYEPVWAISSTQNHRDASPEDFQEMRIYIRKILSDMVGANTAESVAILYGGSVNEKNANGFLSLGGADGLLVGKASLTPKIFLTILKRANEIQ